MILENANPLDRIAANLRAFIREAFPRLHYTGVFEYTITGVTGRAPSCKIDCVPVDASLGLPAFNSIGYSPSVSGVTGTPTAGLTCVVVFLDGNPTKPRIMGIDSLGANPIAVLGNQVQVFLPPTLPIMGVVTPGGPFTGTIQVLNPISGTITQGSGRMVGGG